MKEITIYECADGTRFDKKEDAMNYDVLLLKCSEVENSIGKKRELEYDQFIQHDAESVKSAWTKFCDIVAEAIPNYSGWAKECGAGIRHKSHLGRIIDVDSVSKYTWFLRFGKTPYPCAHVRPYGTVPLSRFVIQKYRNKDRTIVLEEIGDKSKTVCAVGISANFYINNVEESTIWNEINLIHNPMK